MKVFMACARHDADNMLCKCACHKSDHLFNRVVNQTGLSIICTAPEYQRRGAAKALMEPILKVADAQGIPSWLEASPDGVRLYENLGFKTVEELNFVLCGNHPMPCMVREPVVAGQ
jgi:predicted acetyltransferase